MNIGITQGEYGDHYPFVDPSEDIRHAFYDMHVSLNTSENELPLHIQRFSKNPENPVIVLEDAENNTVFDSRATECSPQNYPWNQYRIYSWEAPGIQVHLIADTAQLPDTVIPENAVLDLRTVYATPPRIQTLNGYSGVIQIKAGNNLLAESLDSQRAEIRDPSIITLGAVSGAGAGRVPSEEIDLASIKTINGMPPDSNGSIFLKADGGHSLSTACHSLYLSNSNTPCCECSDMERLAQYINAVADQYRLLGAKLSWLKNFHKQQMDYWNAVHPCSSAEAVHLQLTASHCPWVELSVRITNLYKSCASSFTAAGSFSPQMLELSRSVSAHEDADAEPFFIWKDGVPYSGTTHKLRHIVSSTAEMNWTEIQPGETVTFRALYRIQGTPPAAEQEITWNLNSLHAVYSDGTEASLGSPFLSGEYAITATLDCSSTGEDTVENTEIVEQIQDEIWDLKQSRYSSCEETP